MTSQVLRSLEAKGLIAREIDPVDSRARRVNVTAAGAELAPRAIEVVERVDGAFFAGLPESAVLEVLAPLAGLGDPVGRPST
jgi:DNA-binding MarR family transcriptional regulator